MTISGPAVGRKGNYRIPIGTPLRFALEQVEVSEDVSRVFLGGPMMGQALSSLDIPITKGTSGFVAFTAAQTGDRPTRVPVHPLRLLCRRLPHLSQPVRNSGCWRRMPSTSRWPTTST